ncbi:MAG: hypothetical protein A2381_08495 [Bdellovibrionales bacterium RIFOXYB1_FULL_37_110]|nr:MAG: hypothetical protein A2417_14170 [Bdellovibrionales bacterium RIFOXYC1_FULL_37_79]OFZ58245.1 MAG: hypothetical protein A2381_08495 [Bdellovibrionales bacterium RIFOXYB1_FULL_37_110]OFZ65542.1 MAG: hypothetical protein A2577_08245 [Bdellovibrionales bacterium RIFOXYD1_FULL_36_51]
MAVNKLILFFIILIQSLAIWPSTGSKCMDAANYRESLICTESHIVFRDIKGQRVKTIHTQLGAIINSVDVQNESDLIATFLDFDSWGKYALREGGEILVFRSSKKLKALTQNGNEILRHYAYFGTKAPAPLYRQWVRTVINYWKVPSPLNVLLTYKFISDDGISHVEGEKVLIGSEGMKYYEGFVSIIHDPKSLDYIVYTEFWLVPSINILPEFAIPSIERGLVALVRGMFEL